MSKETLFADTLVNAAIHNGLVRLEFDALARPEPALDVIARASQEVRSGIFYATIIIVLVFVPLFALSGIEGRVFSPLGLSLCLFYILGSIRFLTDYQNKE